MSRLKLPEFKSTEEAFKYLRENHDEIIAQKCAFPVKAEICDLGCDSIEMSKSNFANKSSFIPDEIKTSEDDSLSDEEVKVKAFANVSGWCDSHMDVLMRDSAKKTIKDKGASNKQLIYHLKNHGRGTDDIIGKNVKLSLEDVDLKKYKIKSDIKTAQAIVGESVVSKKYDEKCFYLYQDGEIKQHSIGLMYVKIFFCMNSDAEEDEQYKKNWDKYYSEVINKEKVDERGYFWAVTQIRLLEYSAVLWGSNELSVTEEVSKASITEEPSNDTPPKTEGKSSSDTDSEKRRLILLYS